MKLWRFARRTFIFSRDVDLLLIAAAKQFGCKEHRRFICLPTLNEVDSKFSPPGAGHEQQN